MQRERFFPLLSPGAMLILLSPAFPLTMPWWFPFKLFVVHLWQCHTTKPLEMSYGYFSCKSCKSPVRLLSCKSLPTVAKDFKNMQRLHLLSVSGQALGLPAIGEPSPGPWPPDPHLIPTCWESRVPSYCWDAGPWKGPRMGRRGTWFPFKACHLPLRGLGLHHLSSVLHFVWTEWVNRINSYKFNEATTSLDRAPISSMNVFVSDSPRRESDSCISV